MKVRQPYVGTSWTDEVGTGGEGSATFSSLDPNGTPSLQTTNANAEAVYAYDSKPSTGSFPWNLFSTQIAAAAMSDLEGRLAAVASKSGGSWQVTLFSYDRDGQPALIRRSRGGLSRRSRPWPTEGR
jgi:hypothetical protein